MKKQLFLMFVILCSMLYQLYDLNAKEIKLTENNHCYWYGPFTHHERDTVINCLKKLDSKRKNVEPIYLVFKSNGGYLEIMDDFLAFSPKIRNMHTITIQSISAAAMLVQRLPGKRYITKNGGFLFHEASWRGTGKVIKSATKEEFAKFHKRLKLTLDEVLKKIDGKDWVAYDDEAVANNMADEVVSIKCSKKLIKKRKYMIIPGYYQKEKVISACPSTTDVK